MAENKRQIVVCSCEDTMPLDVEALKRSLGGAEIVAGRQFCRAELDRFRALLPGQGSPQDDLQGNLPGNFPGNLQADLVVACTQEAPVFEEAAGEGDVSLAFVNIRENAGWSNEAGKAAPKMAALLAAAAEPIPDIPFVALESDGVILIYGRDERAIEAAELLKDHLDVTVLIAKPEHLAPRRKTEFPVVKGTIRNAKGFLGAFELTIDDYAQPAPSSRDQLKFGTSRNGALSKCDIVLDLSRGASLFPAADLRDGYLRADPGDPAAILRMVMKARDLTGTFDKPRYVTYDADLCAHSRSRIVGCRRCLDLCPTGAITPAGDHVAISAEICAGCGQCAAACPTGAASYALPPADALMRKLRTMLMTYRDAGGRNAVILFHDGEHGTELIDALARHGSGLPAHVIPFAVNEITQVGLETIAAAFAYGANGMRFLLRARPRHDVIGLTRTIALAEPILAGLGYGAGRVAAIETDDPDALGDALRTITPGPARTARASFRPVGGKRDLQRLALRELHRVAPQPVDMISLPLGAPLGAIAVDAEGCTLCLACVSACPTGAMSADPDRPMLKFTEDACVQCGLCAATCPEKVITLQPQVDFRAATASPRIMKQEDPFECIRCSKPFGVRSTIERVTAKLEGKHWMFKGQADRLNVLKMCEDCRVTAMTEQAFDPYGSGIPERPKPRTADDYLREADEKGRS